MPIEVSPPEGKTSFSGIPESQFIDDVDSYMKGEDNAEAKIKSFDEVKILFFKEDASIYKQYICRFTKNTNLWKAVLVLEGKGLNLRFLT